MKAAATNDKDTPFLPHKGAFHGSHSGADSSDTHTNTRRLYTGRKEMNTQYRHVKMIDSCAKKKALCSYFSTQESA